jgi:hypothetical protein
VFRVDGRQLLPNRVTSELPVTLTQSSDIRIGVMNKHQIELALEITESFNVAAYM